MSEPKVDTQMVERVKKLRAKGKTQEEIAGEVRLAQGTVSLILRSTGLGGKLVKR